MTILDPEKTGESMTEDTAGGVSRFAVMAGLAINLAGVIPASAAQQPGNAELSPAEHFAQTWGDCVDE